MNTFIDRQLTQIRVREMLQEAAEARADRKARIAHPTSVARKLRTALVVISVVLAIVWASTAG